MPKANALPDNIMELEDKPFFEFVKMFAGNKVSQLLEFQDINSVQCFLTCNDPFEILSYESDDLLDLKKKTCVKLNTNLHIALPGIQSNMKLLKSALTKKKNQTEREITPMSLNQIMTNNTSSNTSFVDNSFNGTFSSEQESTNNTSSINTSSTFEKNIKNHLINALKEWCQKIKQNNNQHNFEIEEGIDYEIIVNSISNKAYIKCQCGKNTTLGQKNNSFIVSHFYFDFYTFEKDS